MTRTTTEIIDILEALADPTPRERGVCPFDERASLGAVCSNLDGRVDEEVARRVVAGEGYGDHRAWDFHGTVWFADGAWHEEVRVRRRLAAHLVGATLADVIRQARERFGDD